MRYTSLWYYKTISQEYDIALDDIGPIIDNSHYGEIFTCDREGRSSDTTIFIPETHPLFNYVLVAIVLSDIEEMTIPYDIIERIDASVANQITEIIKTL